MSVGDAWDDVFDAGFTEDVLQQLEEGKGHAPLHAGVPLPSTASASSPQAELRADSMWDDVFDDAIPSDEVRPSEDLPTAIFARCPQDEVEAKTKAKRGRPKGSTGSAALRKAREQRELANADTRAAAAEEVPAELQPGTVEYARSCKAAKRARVAQEAAALHGPADLACAHGESTALAPNSPDAIICTRAPFWSGLIDLCESVGSAQQLAPCKQ